MRKVSVFRSKRRTRAVATPGRSIPRICPRPLLFHAEVARAHFHSRQTPNRYFIYSDGRGLSSLHLLCELLRNGFRRQSGRMSDSRLVRAKGTRVTGIYRRCVEHISGPRASRQMRIRALLMRVLSSLINCVGRKNYDMLKKNSVMLCPQAERKYGFFFFKSHVRGSFLRL